MQKGLAPFFNYFGGKNRAASLYPAPLFDTIIEPFAGAAGYSCLHHTKKVVLYDVDPVIAGVWSFLIRATQKEILALPTGIEHIDDLKACQEARCLVGFWFVRGVTGPRKKPGSWAKASPEQHWSVRTKNRIAKQLPYIRHWQIKQASYAEIEKPRATWFVDPPYIEAGKAYKFHSIDYPALGAWCQTLQGQVMVCEAYGAKWLPFSEFRTIPGTLKRSHEVLWESNT